MMTASALGLTSPFLCFAAHALTLRLVPGAKKISAQKVTALVILAMAAAVAGWCWYLTKNVPQSLHAAVLSVVFGYIYFHFFNMSDTARRIRILVRYVALNESPSPEHGGEARRIFENRIVRMTHLGTILERNGKFILLPGPLLHATRVIMFWRRLFYGRS